jgi:hypothetical protein
MQALLFSFFPEESLETPILPEKKAAQREIILNLLGQGPQHCGVFLRHGIAQYNARIYELRKKGYDIKYSSEYRVFTIVSDASDGELGTPFVTPCVMSIKIINKYSIYLNMITKHITHDDKTEVEKKLINYIKRCKNEGCNNGNYRR